MCCSMCSLKSKSSWCQSRRGCWQCRSFWRCYRSYWGWGRCSSSACRCTCSWWARCSPWACRFTCPCSPLSVGRSWCSCEWGSRKLRMMKMLWMKMSKIFFKSDVHHRSGIEVLTSMATHTSVSMDPKDVLGEADVLDEGCRWRSLDDLDV